MNSNSHDAIRLLEHYYRSLVDGEWEQQHQIKIESTDNPGWQLTCELPQYISISQDLILQFCKHHRSQAILEEGQIRLFSNSLQDLTACFGELVTTFFLPQITNGKISGVAGSLYQVGDRVQISETCPWEEYRGEFGIIGRAPLEIDFQGVNESEFQVLVENHETRYWVSLDEYWGSLDDSDCEAITSRPETFKSSGFFPESYLTLVP